MLCYAQRKADIQFLVHKFHEYGLIGWDVSYAEFSVTITNKKRTRSIKMDAYKRCVIDRIQQGQVRSRVIQSETLAETWNVARTALDKFTR